MFGILARGLKIVDQGLKELEVRPHLSLMIQNAELMVEEILEGVQSLLGNGDQPDLDVLLAALNGLVVANPADDPQWNQGNSQKPEQQAGAQADPRRCAQNPKEFASGFGCLDFPEFGQGNHPSGLE